MFRTLIGFLIVLMISLWVSPKANAETIILLSGQKIEGQILEQTELRITVDVKGIPRTFYLGEIATIDGKALDMPQPKAVDKPSAEPLKPDAPPISKDEKDSLDRFMDKRVANPPADKSTTVHQAPAVQAVTLKTSSPTQDLQKATAMPKNAGGMTGKVSDTNKNVVTTADGGIIVVGANSIVKYDKDLNLIKKIDLKADNSVSSP